MSQSQTSQSEKIGIFEKVAYGGGDLASNLILVLAMTYVTFFYTDALGLNPAIIGSIMMFSKFFDGFTDILIGFFMDKTKSRWGKARPWLLFLAIPIAIALVLLFLVPNTGTTGQYIYIAITYNLITTFLYTAINIPYGAMTALMTRDQNERMIVNAFRMFMAQIGSLFINATTLPLLNALGGSGEQKSWVILSIIYGITAAALFLLCFAKTKERVVVTTANSDRLPLSKALGSLIRNSQWLILVLVWLFMIFGASMSGISAIYYAKYVLGNENVAGFLTSMAIIPVLIIIPLAVPLNMKFGKRNVAMVGSVISLGGQLLILLNPESTNWLLFCSLIKGIGSGTMSATMFAMIADTIEFGHWKTGTRVEGMTYSSTTFGAKVGGGIGAAIALSYLASAGYDGLLDVQSQTAIDAIKFLYLYVAIPFMIATPILYWFYKLDKIYPQVISDLRSRGE